MDSRINEKNTPIHPNKRDSSDSSDSKAKVDSMTETEAQKLGLSLIPCAYCDFKHYNTFDLGNHLYEKHKQELIALPIGREYGIEYRITYVIEKGRIQQQNTSEESEDDDADVDDDDGNDEPYN